MEQETQNRCCLNSGDGTSCMHNEAQTDVLAKMKELYRPYKMPFGREHAIGFMDGYSASRSLINSIPINQATRDAFMKWACK